MTTGFPSPAGRLLGPAATLLGSTGNALQNAIPDLLPNGALCYVVEEDSLYQLAKFSLEALDGTRVIATIRGASARGRWIRVAGGAGADLAPLPTLLFVSNLLLVDNPTGFIAAPFPTLQAAIDAVPMDTGGTIIVASGPPYTDAWEVPENLTVDIYGAGGIQGGEGGEAVIAAGTLNNDANVRLQNLVLADEAGQITVLGSGTLFCWNVNFNHNPIVQSGAGGWFLRIAGDGISDSNPGRIHCAQIAAQNITFGGEIDVSGILARIFYCILEGDINFTGSAGVVLTDLFSLNTLRGHASNINNGTAVATDAPTTTHTIAVPEFVGAGTANVSVAIAGAAPGDTFSVTNLTALPDNVTIGVLSCVVAGTVKIQLLAVAASIATDVDIAITRFNGGLS